MADSWKKLLTGSLLCHAVAFGFLLLLSVFSFTTRTVLAELQWQWIAATTWAEFYRLAPAVQGWAVLLVFALIAPMSAAGRAGSSFDRFGRSIIVLLAITLVFSVGYLVGYPSAVARVESLELTTTIASRLLDSAETARRERDYQRAEELLNQYLSLVVSSEEIESLLIEVREQARLQPAPETVEEAPLELRVPVRATAAELVDRAVAAMDRSDYSTAHYMAILAQALEPNNDEAARIGARSLEVLASLAPGDRESDEGRLFWRKQRARESFTRQDYVDAYYQFAALAEEYPRDPDVVRYLRAAEEQVAGLTVFRDDVEDALRLPGTPGLVFVNRADEQSVELVAIDKIVAARTGVYAQQIEWIEVDREGSVLRHGSSPYGKHAAGHFILNVIDRGSTPRVTGPTVLSGEPSAITDGLLDVRPAADELILLADVSRRPDAANIAALSRTIRAAGVYGMVPEPIELEFLMRVVVPFSFLVLSLALMGLGWRYRSRYLHLPPLPTLVLVPLIPFLLIPVSFGLVYAQRIVLAAFLLAVGFGGALALTVVLQAVLLFASLAYLALGARE